MTTSLQTHDSQLSPADTLKKQKRSLLASGTAHAVHDGLTDLVYVLLPIWQQQFGLAYAMVGVLRGVYSGVMAVCQLGVGRLVPRWGSKNLLVAGTLLVGLAYLLAGQANGMLVLLLALALGGLGASTQHPLASSLLANSHSSDEAMKRALSHYNFAGDIGKTLIPALVGVSLAYMSWRSSLTLMGALGLLTALLLALLIPAPGKADPAAGSSKPGATGSDSRAGFWALQCTGMLDSAVRMGFLTFLPFLLKAKGAGSSGIGLALSLLFIGGAFGKLFCGYLGARIGMMKTVWITEGCTAFMVAASVFLPLTPMMLMLPLLGLVLNGTSSVLYGSVPAFGAVASREQLFAWFYTGTIGGGALAPVIFGGLGDMLGITAAMLLLASLLLLTLPLAWKVDNTLKASAV